MNFHKFCVIYLPVNKLFYFDLYASAGSFMVLQVFVHVSFQKQCLHERSGRGALMQQYTKIDEING